MAFIIIGPGIQEPVRLDTLFDQRLVDRTGEISAKRRIEANRPVEPWERHPDVLVRRKNDQAFNTYQKIEKLHEERPVLFARQIMTEPVVTLLQGARIGDAVKLFHDRRFRHIPVVRDEGDITGMISDRDVLHLASGLTENYERRSEPFDDNATVEQLMKSPVLTAGADTDVRLIARLFVDYHIGAIPIVAMNNTITGIISRSDILRAVMRHYALELWI